VLSARADAKGRFRLPLHQAESYAVYLAGGPGTPFLRRTQEFAWPKGAVVRKEVNFALTRGVPVRGKVTEQGGKAVAGARVDFWSEDRKLPDGVRPPHPLQTGADGTFQAVLPPGSWDFLVNAPKADYVFHKIAAARLATGTQKCMKCHGPPGAKEPAADGPPYVYPDALQHLDLKAGTAVPDTTLTLRRAPQIRGRLVGANGEGVRSARLFLAPPVPAAADADSPRDASRRRLQGEFLAAAGRLYHNDVLVSTQRVAARDLPDGIFAVTANDPESTYRLFFRDAAGSHGAVLEVAGSKANDTLRTVHLKPCGQVQARFRDAKGKPLANYRPVLWLLTSREAAPVPVKNWKIRGQRMPGAVWLGHVDPQHYGKGPHTDAEGRVTLPALIPGARYRVTTGDGKDRDFTIQPGQTLVLPDLTIEQAQAAGKLPEIQPRK
jgi:hypothetical protein